MEGVSVVSGLGAKLVNTTAGTPRAEIGQHLGKDPPGVNEVRRIAVSIGQNRI